MKIKLITIASALAIGLMTSAWADSFSVLGTSKPWLAGQPDDSTSPGDGLPFQFTNFAAADLLHFTAFGLTNYGGGPDTAPDGDVTFPLSNAAFNNISGIDNSQAMALIAVFLDDTNPLSADPLSTPATLDFGPSGLTLGYMTLSPQLRQMFYIGDGLTGTGTGTQQTIVAPAGATRLFLGTNDGTGWFNNTGSFDVTVTGNTNVPEPSTWTMLGIGALGFLSRARRVKGRSA